jgi:uncharacterized membrane protein YcaP (DUF421 family)
LALEKSISGFGVGLLDSVFGVQNSITWWHECARAILVFGYGLALVRIAGRRVFGKWAPLDIIVSIVVGSSLSRTITGNAALFSTLAAMTLLNGICTGSSLVR